MNEETFIPAQDVLAKIKYHPDITEKDKQDFKYLVSQIWMTEETREKNKLPIKKNQDRATNKRNQQKD
jgi:hypothetical protein